MAPQVQAAVITVLVFIIARAGEIITIARIIIIDHPHVAADSPVVFHLKQCKGVNKEYWSVGSKTGTKQRFYHEDHEAHEK